VFIILILDHHGQLVVKMTELDLNKLTGDVEVEELIADIIPEVMSINAQCYTVGHTIDNKIGER
jgi:hypothetical protein